jgi:hypothetical protein
MDIQTKVKSGAKIELRIGLTSDGVRHIKIVADSVESRDWAMTQVKKLLPDLSEAPSVQHADK